MPLFSYLDPQLDFEFARRFLQDIEDIILVKNNEVNKQYKKWEKENVNSKKDEWYQWQEDYFVNEWFFISELKRNLLNGLALTINTTFEIHIGIFVREIYKKNNSKKYNEKYTYRMDEFRNILKKFNHPNHKEITSDMWNRLRIYTEIRNCIVHNEGRIPDHYANVKSFIIPDLRKIYLI